MKSNKLLRLWALSTALVNYPVEIRLLAVAVTAAEMKFRPFPLRLVEYIVVFIAMCFGKSVGKFSIGISQISIRHRVLDFEESEFQSILSLMSARKSLETCCSIIAKHPCTSLQLVAESYNGRCSVFYSVELKKNYTRLIALLENLTPGLSAKN